MQTYLYESIYLAIPSNLFGFISYLSSCKTYVLLSIYPVYLNILHLHPSKFLYRHEFLVRPAPPFQPFRMISPDFQSPHAHQHYMDYQLHFFSAFFLGDTDVFRFRLFFLGDEFSSCFSALMLSRIKLMFLSWFNKFANWRDRNKFTINNESWDCEKFIEVIPHLTYTNENTCQRFRDSVSSTQTSLQVPLELYNMYIGPYPGICTGRNGEESNALSIPFFLFLVTVEVSSPSSMERACPTASWLAVRLLSISMSKNSDAIVTFWPFNQGPLKLLTCPYIYNLNWVDHKKETLQWILDSSHDMVQPCLYDCPWARSTQTL